MTTRRPGRTPPGRLRAVLVAYREQRAVAHVLVHPGDGNAERLGGIGDGDQLDVRQRARAYHQPATQSAHAREDGLGRVVGAYLAAAPRRWPSPHGLDQRGEPRGPAACCDRCASGSCPSHSSRGVGRLPRGSAGARPRRTPAGPKLLEYAARIASPAPPCEPRTACATSGATRAYAASIAPLRTAVEVVEVPEQSEQAARAQQRAAALARADLRVDPVPGLRRRRSGRTGARRRPTARSCRSRRSIPCERATSAIRSSISTPSTSTPRAASSRAALPVPQPTSRARLPDAAREGRRSARRGSSAGPGRRLRRPTPNDSARRRLVWNGQRRDRHRGIIPRRPASSPPGGAASASGRRR